MSPKFSHHSHLIQVGKVNNDFSHRQGSPLCPDDPACAAGYLKNYWDPQEPKNPEKMLYFGQGDCVRWVWKSESFSFFYNPLKWDRFGSNLFTSDMNYWFWKHKYSSKKSDFVHIMNKFDIVHGFLSIICSLAVQK